MTLRGAGLPGAARPERTNQEEKKHESSSVCETHLRKVQDHQAEGPRNGHLRKPQAQAASGLRNQTEQKPSPAMCSDAPRGRFFSGRRAPAPGGGAGLSCTRERNRKRRGRRGVWSDRGAREKGRLCGHKNIRKHGITRRKNGKKIEESGGKLLIFKTNTDIIDNWSRL